MSDPSIPKTPLSSFYFFYFAIFGVFMPYFGLYLTHIGFSEKAIGEMMALLLITRIIAPNFWGYVADKTGARLTLVRIGSWMLMLFWVGIFWVNSFWSVFWVLCLYSFFQHAILPQFEAITIAHLKERRELYSMIRLWGSAGFMVAGWILGVVFDKTSISYLPHAMMVLVIISCVVCYFVPDVETASHKTSSQGLWQILQRRPVYIFFVLQFLLQLAHAPLYSFYSIYLEQHHYSHAQIGSLWAISVFSEIIIFTQMAKLLPRYGEHAIFVVSLILAVVRWLMIAFGVDSLVILVLAQCLHAATFAAFHAAAMSFIYRHFGDGHQGQGQAVYSMLWGIGVALGSWATGAIWKTHASWSYIAAALICVLAVLLAHPRIMKFK